MSAEFTITGRYAYGLMTAERGTHRLVRISPFDNQGRRQTSFAARAGVAGDGRARRRDQRVRHPHGGVPGLRRRRPARQQDVVGGAPDPRADRAGGVSSQEERSQLQNREKAMSRLKAMIAAKIEEEREAELDSIAGQQAQVGWGSQIRSYVVQPYQMVKDLRTEVEIGQRRRRARRRPRRVHGGLPAVATARSAMSELVFHELRAAWRLQQLVENHR